MSAWSELRHLARDWHDELHPGAGLVRARELLAAACEASGVKIVPVDADDIMLDGGEACYDPDGARIFVSKGLSEEDAVFHIAHEFGHHRLHHPHGGCSGADFDAFTPAEPDASPVGESDSYSPKQRREGQANVFAREFLLPRGRLRTLCLATRPSPSALALALGISPTLVSQQMADALLLPDEPEPEAAREVLPPDPSQKKAIEAGPGPRQVRAGPGAGKTRTLIGRIAYLINEKGVDPGSILALTYSNGSAEDLARRIRVEVGPKATGVWSSTFHAFGQELLRLHGGEIGLPPSPKLLDRPGSLFRLERELSKLTLDHYLDLQEPLRALRSVLNAVSRAKDELCTPADYRRLVDAMPEGDAKAKALEVAHIYEVYDAALRADRALDFGDLIARSVELLSNHPAVATQVRSVYRHVLVDEYQDMNFASAALLALLVEPGVGPWVVGDVRQAIYRFRGASPFNMSRFGERFAGAETTDLEVNYRSGGRIVSLFEAFGATMAASPFASQKPLDPSRGADTGRVDYQVAATREAEAEGIAQAIISRSTEPGGFRRHAVLARTHGVLASLAAHFERAGVPALYFGDFFERGEIRDLLSLLSVAGEPDGVGLLRLAQVARYAVPVPDLLAVFRFREQSDLTMLAALRRLGEVQLSAEGRPGLERLGLELSGVSHATAAHELLSDHLFGRGAVYEPPFSGDDVAAQQRRLAAYQLLQLTFAFRVGHGRDSKRAFLDHVRRLEVLDEEKELRRLPAAAAGIDAVRLMTVHAAKGLEFPIVHIPSVSASYFPASGRADPCPAPPGLVDDDPLMAPEAEEESLFFVGLSRARDELVISRALRYGGASRPKPSPIMAPILNRLPAGRDNPPSWQEIGVGAPAFGSLATSGPIGAELSVYAVEDYIACPRRYYYGEGLGLSSRLASTPYLRFHSVIRSGLGFLRDPAADRSGLAAHIDEAWTASGPAEHPAASHYRAAAERMLGTAAGLMSGQALGVERRLLVSGVAIVVRADHIQSVDGRIHVHRLKAGRLAKAETPKTRYGLLQAVVARDEGQGVGFSHVSLVTGESRDGTLAADKIAKTVDETAGALDGISAGRFDPVRNPRNCPTCPFFFICPTDGIPA